MNIIKIDLTLSFSSDNLIYNDVIFDLSRSETAQKIEEANQGERNIHIGLDFGENTPLLPGTGLFHRMEAAGEIVHNNYPEDWQKYDFVDVVFDHKNMGKDLFFVEIRKQWDALYNDNTLKKKFLRTLKQTKSPFAAIWSYGSNLQYYNLVNEGRKPKKNIEDIFGLDETGKALLKSSPFK